MRELFRIDPEIIYLNSGSHSLTPRPVLSAIKQYQDEYERNPTAALMSSSAQLWERQRELAIYLNADPEDLFLRPNVTLPLNDFILRAPLDARRKTLLVGDLEYGAVTNIARVRAEQAGLEVKTLRLPSDLEATHGLGADDLAELVIAQLHGDCAMLILSHVVTSTGLVLPIEKIARAARERGILSVIDGAHAPGALALDAAQWEDVDFYAGNLHKWMMGPKGTAFGWVNKRQQPPLKPTHVGWTTFGLDHPFKGFGGGHAFAERFLMLGCYDFAPFFAIREMLAFWRELGADAIRARIRELQHRVETEVRRQLGWRELSPPPGALRGPLLGFDLPASLARENPFELMMRIWNEYRLQILVSTVKGRPYLRITPHIYNTPQEIERAVAILAELERRDA